MTLLFVADDHTLRLPFGTGTPDDFTKAADVFIYKSISASTNYRAAATKARPFWIRTNLYVVAEAFVAHFTIKR